MSILATLYNVFKRILSKLSKQERDVKKLLPVLEKVNSFGEAAGGLSDEEFARAKNAILSGATTPPPPPYPRL